ncbi:hypothetical protein Tco_1191438 [Tanacetum coccineum]
MKASNGKVLKVRKGKRSGRLVDKEEKEPQPAPEPQIEDDEYNLQRGIQMSLELFQAPVCGVAIHEPTLGDDTSINVVRDTSSPVDAKTRADTEKSDSQAGSDPSNILESRSPPNEDQAGPNLRQSHVALGGPNLEPMHEDFIATVYPKVHKSLKHTTEEHAFLENPPRRTGKANMESKTESMVTIPIHQASSSVPPLSTPVIDLIPPKAVSPLAQEPVFTATTATKTTTLLPPPPPQQQSTTDPTLAARVLALEQIYANFEKKNKMKEILRDQMFESGSYRSQTEHTTLYEALEASMDRENRDEFVEETVKSHNVHMSNTEDTDAAHLLKFQIRPDWKKKLSKADLEGPAFKVDLTNPEGNRVVPNVSKPLPLGGPPGQVTIQPQYFFNKDLEYLVSGDKERRNALSISKLKAAYYLYFGLKELVMSLWIESEFYIRRHNSPSDRRAIKSHMRILSVVSLKTFTRYGYTYLKRIILRRVDYKEYKISEADLKNLHPNDFEDLYLLHLQGNLNYLSSADKVYLFNAVNL